MQLPDYFKEEVSIMAEVKTPLMYGKEACDAIMHYEHPADFWPKGAMFYIPGVFLSGMQRIWKLTGEKKYFDFIKLYFDTVLPGDGSLYGINHELTVPDTEGSPYNYGSLTMLDCKQPSILLYDIYDETGDEKYLKPIKTIGQSMYYWPVNQYGGYWHMMTEPNQMWMDGAYMAGPLSVKYAKRFGEPVLRERAIKQVFLMDDFIKDKKSGLYFHGWDISKKAEWADPETGLSANIWGRAVGWYAVAVLDILDDIPKDHPAVERLKQIETDLLKTLVKYQDSVTGKWYQVLDKPGEEGNWVETSCTCLFIYSYAKAIRRGILDASYASVLEKAYQGVVDDLYYDENGYVVLDGVCMGTCIQSGTYEHYINRKQVKNDLHGMGAFVLMCAEMELYRNVKKESCAQK